MVACPSCKKQIADNLIECPHCQIIIEKWTRRQQKNEPTAKPLLHTRRGFGKGPKITLVVVFFASLSFYLVQVMGVKKGAEMAIPAIFINEKLVTSFIDDGNLKGVQTALEAGLLKNCRNGGIDFVIEAIDYNRFEIFKEFLKAGVDVNQVGEHNQSALDFVIGQPVKMHTKYDPYVKELILHGLDIHRKDANGTTVLMILVLNNFDISPLLEKGIDVNEKNNEGKSALAFAKQVNNQAGVELLVKAGAVE